MRFLRPRRSGWIAELPAAAGGAFAVPGGDGPRRRHLPWQLALQLRTRPWGGGSGGGVGFGGNGVMRWGGVVGWGDAN